MIERKITWTAKAIRQFNAAIAYIRQDSLQNAGKVKEKVLEKVNELSRRRVVHHKDPHKKDNDGSFLYFEISKHRIVYPVRGDEVFIIRVSHTSREPKPY